MELTHGQVDDESIKAQALYTLVWVTYISTT